MTQSLLVPIILGHNQFFGVNHLSAAQGADRAIQFSDPNNILKIIKDAVELGAGGLMLSTHQRAGLITELILRDNKVLSELVIYPLLPYIQKYVTRANEIGMINVVLEELRDQNLRGKIATLWTGSKGLLTKDINATLATLMRLELKAFRGLNVPVIFLHDALTDLALALGLKDIFYFYLEEIEQVHGSKGAFTTKNAPLLLQKLSDWGLPDPIVMTHVNKLGFQMNPTRDACLKSFAEHQAEIVAMSTLASGYLRPKEAFQFLSRVPEVKSVVVGASSRFHLEETFAQLRATKIGEVL